MGNKRNNQEINQLAYIGVKLIQTFSFQIHSVFNSTDTKAVHLEQLALTYFSFQLSEFQIFTVNCNKSILNFFFTLSFLFYLFKIVILLLIYKKINLKN